MKVGVIAGGGDLPHHVIEGAKTAGHDVFVIALSGSSEAGGFAAETAKYQIAEFGKHIKAFRKAGCTHICFAGQVNRPDFSKLKPDWKAVQKLPGAIRAAKAGDDQLLKYIVDGYENEGFAIISPQELCAHLVLPPGYLGHVHMTSNHREDADKACRIAAEIGKLDIGQGAVVCRGLVLAVEAQEGTDAMLKRVSELPLDIRGSEQIRAGVLAKIIKPGQETRIDLPTIGPETVKRASKAGLAGIVAEGGGAFVIDQPQVIALANNTGLFICGLPPIGS